MHTLNCLVAVGGDVNNKTFKGPITCAEMQLLRHIHGQDAVTDIEVIGNPRVSQTDERDALFRKYPKHNELIMGMWRDHGGKFEGDIRKLKLHPNFFKPDRTAPYETADKLEEEAVDKVKSEAELVGEELL